MGNERQEARQLLQQAGIEIELSDHRTAVEVARAFGLIGIDGSNEHQNQTQITQRTILPKTENGNPYLAF